MQNEFFKYSEDVSNELFGKFTYDGDNGVNNNYTDFDGGNGTASYPYLISNVTHLKNVSKYLSAHFKLKNDIDASDYGSWTPVGANQWGYKSVPDNSACFRGVFDGSNHKITCKIDIPNLNKNNSYAYGLFGVVNGATIKNLRVDALISTNGTIEQDYSPHSVFAGGIVGRALSSTTISGCTVAGLINTNFTTTNDANYSDGYHHGTMASGGVAGAAYYSTISGCANGAKVFSSGYYADAGGIVGWTINTSVGDCSNSGNISASHGDWWMGGHSSGNLVGNNQNK
jgi:hypothetical protein